MVNFFSNVNTVFQSIKTRGILLGILLSVPPGPPVLTLFQTKKCHFSHSLFRPGLWESWSWSWEIMSSLLKNGNKKYLLKYISNPHISFFFFLIHSRSSRPTWARSIPVFRSKRLKNYTLWGGTCLYGLYKGVPPSLVLTLKQNVENRKSLITSKLLRWKSRFLDIYLNIFFRYISIFNCNLCHNSNL